MAEIDERCPFCGGAAKPMSGPVPIRMQRGEQTGVTVDVYHEWYECADREHLIPDLESDGEPVREGWCTPEQAEANYARLEEALALARAQHI